MGDFARDPKGFRFKWEGMKLNAAPDALAPGKYPIAINIRAYSDTTLRSRPGLTQLFQGELLHQYFTDLRAYAALGTDDLPRILARTADDSIYLDNGVRVGVLAGGGGTSLGPASAAFIPFRPNQSPQPYMYIANGVDYQKFSAPSPSNVVIQQKVGIAEPQVPPNAYLQQYLSVAIASGVFANGGMAGASSGSTRASGAVGAAVFNPLGDHKNWIFQVPSTDQFQRLQFIDTAGNTSQIQDVFPPVVQNLQMKSLYYFTGTTGRCVLVLNTLAGSEDAATVSIGAPNYFASIRRNAIIQIGTEACLVLSATIGPDGTVAVETSTISTHTTAELVALVPALQVMANTPIAITIAPGQAITDPVTARAYVVTAGIGTQQFTLAFNPFINVTSGLIASQDDYLTFGFKVDVLANLTEMKVLIDVSDGTFSKDFYYYTVRAADIAAAINNTITQIAIAQTVTQRALIDEEDAISANNEGVTVSGAQSAPGNNAWTQVAFTLGEMTRVGNDQTKSLMTATAVQFLWNTNATINVVQDGMLFTWGGSWPDVGDVGAPYRYRVRPRSSVTGAKGNPSPETRYGVNPRRMPVMVTLPSATYDSQIDTWDIFRYGGTITSWRFVGSVPSTTTSFQDIYVDDAVGAGEALDFDNFEPWPSIDLPLNVTATAINGTVALVTIPGATNVLRYLPGNLVQIGGLNVYTLRSRPVLISGTTYRFEFEENAGAGGAMSISIYEPSLANQPLPYMWGPDVSGTLFAVGDLLRPGTLYFCKSNAPDSAPDSYNIEIVQPSEPLLGGEVMDGLGFVASTERWWALYPQPNNPLQRYNFVEQPVSRGLAAPSGHCTDGKQIYFWAKDGIWGTSDGSLTDADLYPLFPHEGVPGDNVVYNGQTIPAPDYSQAPKFRLSYALGFLYAIYPTLTGGSPYAMLVCDLKRKAWSLDQYGSEIFNVYKTEQQVDSGSLGTAQLNPVVLMSGLLDPAFLQGAIYTQTDFTNDNLTVPVPIACILAVNEFDGGDVRAPKQWGDFFLDLIPAAAGGVSARPMSLGAGIVAPTIIPSSASRQRLPVSVGGTLVSDFLGLYLSWTDDYTVQTQPTQLFIWQPSFDIQPARTIGWKTFGTSFGLQGFGHIQHIALAWVSTAPITLTVTTFDGTSPQAITIPSSSGAYQKALFTLTFNKGQLFTFQATSTQPFQIFEEDIEIHVGAWARQGPYQIFKSFGGGDRAASPI